MRIKRSLVFGISALTLLGVAGPALAEDGPSGTGDDAQNNPGAAQSERVNEGPEIIVTAQRREQTLLEVPQSISVLGGDTLERQHADNFLDYAPMVPGLSITQSNPGESRLILRGINTGSVGSTVAVYVNDVPFGSSGSLSNGGVLAGDFDTFDVARVEVLRGPQGTLYGSNALGGVIRFITNAPVLGEFEARGQAGVETIDGGGTGWSGNGVINVPLGPGLALRASGFYRRNAGYIDAIGRSGEDINDSDSYGGRGELLFEPTDALSVRLLAMAQNIRADSTSSYDADPVTLDPVNAVTGQPTDELTRYERYSENHDVDYRLYSGNIDYDLGFATLTSVTGFGVLDQREVSDASTNAVRDLTNALYAPTEPGTIGLALQNDVSLDKFTQEVRLASPDSDTFEWLVGGYYTHEKAALYQRYLPFELATEKLIDRTLTLAPGVTTPEFVVVTLDSKYEEIAAFANATVHLTPRFDIGIGGRYSHNDQSSIQVTNQLGSAATITGESSENVFTWSVSPHYQLNDRIALYARVAKGYRPGGPNAVPPGAPPEFPTQFNADTLISYEAGVRGETADRTFGFDASVYYLDWNNVLITTVIVTDTGPYGANANGQGARSIGAEATVTLRPVEGFSTVVNVAYNDAELVGDTARPGEPNLTGGLDGDRLPYAPEWSLNLASDYEWSIGNNATAFVGGNIHLVSDAGAGFSADYRAAFGRRLFVDGYNTVDLRAGVDFDAFSITAYVKNLTNSRGVVSAGGYPFSVPASIGGNGIPLVRASSIRPRTIGATIGFAF